MKIRAVTLNNVRRFTDPARVDKIADGLNVLCAPNEHGKSTLFDAIQALFFKPHGSRDKDIASLRPHAGGAPEVNAEVETKDGHFTLAKRWFQKPAATVHRDGTLIAQSDEAEAWISRLLGHEAGAPSGLIWVRQGMTELTSGTKKEQESALEVRRDLMSSVGAEVEAMTGGRRMDTALARCRDELAVHATGTGRPKTGGPWKTAQDRVAQLAERRESLATTVQALNEALAERTRARRDLRELEAPEAAEERRKRLNAARTAHAAAERHAAELEVEFRKVETARLQADRAGSRLETLRTALSERREATRLVAEAEEKAGEQLARRDMQRALRDEADHAVRTAEAELKDAERSRTLALRAKAARDGADRRKELQDRIARAEQARSAMETAAASRAGPDPATLRRIEKLAHDHVAAIASRNATAPQVIARYAQGREGMIRDGETPLPPDQPVPLPHASRLTIEGVGVLDVRPGESNLDDRSIEAAADKLHKALAEIGADDLNAARTAAAARADAERQHGEASAVLANLAPDGIDALRNALALIPKLETETDTPDPQTAEAALDAARAAHDTARADREAAIERLSDLRDAASHAEATLASHRDRLKRAEAALARSGEASEDSLVAEARMAAEAHRTAKSIHEEKARNAPDLAGTQAALNRAESVERQAQQESVHLRSLLARLDERIARSSGDAVEERLAETEQELEAATADLAQIEHEIAVLVRLEQALETARNEARDRYFEPIAQELKPLLQLLWPDADLTWGEESLLPDKLVRNGQPEPIDMLSGGTREQIALLVRLAFARMLATSGRVAPVILDDALVFTDDDRIERMFDALHRQAGDLQIIVLTCRQRAFRDLGGKALRLSTEPTIPATQ